MSDLEDWVANGWLTRHQATTRETRDLLDAARSDLADAQKDLCWPISSTNAEAVVMK